VLTRSQQLEDPLKLASKWPVSAVTKRNAILRIPNPEMTPMTLEWCARDEGGDHRFLSRSRPMCAADVPECAFMCHVG
jgi:hypothetical protein